MPHREDQDSNPVSVSVVGLGAIGSQFVPHLGRIKGIEHVRLIDGDKYESSNLSSQNISKQDVGKRKATAQARRLRTQSNMHVSAHPARVEDLPLGVLHTSVIVACLDSREARRYVNQAAWRLGVPWIDTAVDGGGLLARVNVYVPGPDTACLECAWGEQHYAALEQLYPCQRDKRVPSPTNAPAALGSLAASLAAIELEKLLRGEHEFAAIGRQVMIDARYHKHLVTALPRNPGCRFDHGIWRVDALPSGPSELSVEEVFRLGEDEQSHLSSEGQRFVRRVVCPNGCSLAVIPWTLAHRLPSRIRLCPKCGLARVAVGSDRRDRLARSDLANGATKRSMTSMGFRHGDIVRLGGPNGRETHWEFPLDTSPYRTCVRPVQAPHPWKE